MSYEAIFLDVHCSLVQRRDFDGPITERRQKKYVWIVTKCSHVIIFE